MKEEIKKIINENVEELEGIEITDDLQLITSGYIDSFDIISIIEIMEEHFNIEISLDEIDLEQFNTVNSIFELLNKGNC